MWNNHLFSHFAQSLHHYNHLELHTRIHILVEYRHMLDLCRKLELDGKELVLGGKEQVVQQQKQWLRWQKMQ